MIASGADRAMCANCGVELLPKSRVRELSSLALNLGAVLLSCLRRTQPMDSGNDWDENQESITNYPRFRRSETGRNPADETGLTLSAPVTSDTDASDTDAGESVLPAPDNSMQEYDKLKRDLYIVTLVLTGIVTISVWIFYSLNVAINYLLGAISGIVYLRLLARDVDNLDRDNRNLSKTRFALFIGLIVVATQWDRLQILPIFLGFLTYKATLLFYVLPTALLPEIKSSR
jgi:ATP synthase protein I